MAQEQEEEDARRIREEKQREREKIKKKYYDTTWEECDENWSPKLRRSQKKKNKSRFY